MIQVTSGAQGPRAFVLWVSILDTNLVQIDNVQAQSLIPIRIFLLFPLHFIYLFYIPLA